MPDVDPIGDVKLPSVDQRRNKVFAFDSSGEIDLLSQLDQSAQTVTPSGAESALSLARLFGSMVYNVKTFGALGDGVTDDRANIQRAIDGAGDAGGGMVWFPPVNCNAGRYYRLASGPLRMRDNVVLAGAGPASLIRNDNSSGVFEDELVILFGFVHPDHLDDSYDNYPINDIQDGDRTITFDSPADAENFKSGDLIVVMNGLNYSSNKRPIRHDYILTRVVSTGLGTLEVEHAPAVRFTTGSRSAAVDSPRVINPSQRALNFDNSNSAFATQRTGLMNLRLVSDNGYITGRGGALECFMENIWTEGDASPLWGNLWAHSSWHNIWSTVRSKGIEFKLGTHDCRATNIHINYVDAKSPGSAIDFGESCRNITVDGWYISYNDENPSGTPITFSSCKGCTIKNGTLIAPGEGGSIVVFLKGGSGSPDDMPCEDHEFSSNIIVAENGGRFFELTSHNANAVRRIKILHNRCKGTVVADAIVLGGSELHIEGNHFEDGRINFSPLTGVSATQSIIRGNKTTDAANGISIDGLLDNLIVDNHWGSSRRPWDSRLGLVNLTSDYEIPETSQGGPIIANGSATDTVTVTLPLAREGKRFCFMRTTNQTFRIQPASGTNLVRRSGASMTVGEYLELGSNGAYVELVAFNTGSWQITSENGTMTEERP